MSNSCRSGRSNRSKHGGRLSLPQSTQDHARQPVLWMSPAVPEWPIEGTCSGTEQPAGTRAIAITAAAQNGTSNVLAYSKHPRRWAALPPPRTGWSGAPLSDSPHPPSSIRKVAVPQRWSSDEQTGLQCAGATSHPWSAS